MRQSALTVGISGAQRLSASQRWAHLAIDHRAGERRVLNAFRHHRGGHPRPGWGRTGDEVCSTPFGITEVGTRRIPAVLSIVSCAQRLSASQRWARADGTSTAIAEIVLNAFRHHRGGHLPANPPLRSQSMCSTPFGITEVGTGRMGRDMAPRRRAQRLSASQRWAPACRAHPGPCFVRAQRLSASQRWALAPALIHSGDRHVLNAFRHHRGGHNSW